MNDRRAVLENQLAHMDGVPPDGFEDCEWVCRCMKPNGLIQTHWWIYEDSAHECAETIEGEYPGTVCAVFTRMKC
jgi:hypothetical protein